MSHFSGFTVIHSNKIEHLRDLTFEWLATHPLSQPLAEEVFLTQSQGMAQWIEYELAMRSESGVAMALSFQLPSGFLWQVYRTVLGEEHVPKRSAFDRAELIWHLFRRLPDWLEDSAFALIREFLHSNTPLAQYQLCLQLADLYDEYQVYRADWLSAWSEGKNCVFNARGEEIELPESDVWQALLWQKLMHLLPHEHGRHRAGVHSAFLEKMEKLTARIMGLPERIIVFGVSSLPAQTIEALAALSKCCHVLILVHNPCRYFWGDLQEDRALIRRALRHPSRYMQTPALENLHLYAQPLLASFGRQGRDFISLLDEYDQPEKYRANFAKIDVFEDESHVPSTLLAHLQFDIHHLNPLPSSPEILEDFDASISIHSAHSALREVEILHNYLLKLFDEADGQIEPKDVMVMTPDIEKYAPFVQAIFGAKYQGVPTIPFTLADQGDRGALPFLRVFETFLSLSEKRCTMNEVLDWLSLKAFANKFELNDELLQQLRPILVDVGIRWGIDGTHLAHLELPDFPHNTWRAGLERLMLGFATGHADSWHDVLPYAQMPYELASSIAQLLAVMNTLQAIQNDCSQAKTPNAWQISILNLLDQCFLIDDIYEQRCVDKIQQTLETWLERCERAELLDTLMPLELVREVLMEAFQESMRSVNFLGGCVTFGTLMPMRAVPFKVICLLGLSDEAFPRKDRYAEFDLMRKFYRAGDRSKREEDRYLFLEALLSAREYLYFSYVGRDIKTNQSQPASVLLAQCCDWLDARFVRADGKKPSEILFTQHALQPFNLSEFDEYAPRSYVDAWRAEARAPLGTSNGLVRLALDAPFSGGHFFELHRLVRCFLCPSEFFLRQRLGISFSQRTQLEDDEPFELNRLIEHLEIEQILASNGCLSQFNLDNEQDYAQFQQNLLKKMQLEGVLPHGVLGVLANDWIVEHGIQAFKTRQHMNAIWHVVEENVRISWKSSRGVQIEDVLPTLYRDSNDQYAMCTLLIGDWKSNSEDEETGAKLIFLHRLLPFCLRHVLASASGHAWSSVLAATKSPDIAVLAPLSSEYAAMILEQLLAAYEESLCTPLPVTAKMAATWLSEWDETDEGNARAWAATKRVYEPSEFMINGISERDQYLGLAYFWADFEALMQHEDHAQHLYSFQYWTETIYRPLYQLFFKTIRIIRIES